MTAGPVIAEDHDAHVQRRRLVRDRGVQHDIHVSRRRSSLASAERLAAPPPPSPHRSRTAGQIRAAGKVLAEMQANSPVKIEGPTPERVRQAGDEFDVSHAIRSVEVVKNEQRQTEQIRTPRARVSSDPISRLIYRGELDREDEEMNKRLGSAALRYRSLSQTAGRSEIRAQDFTKGFTTSAGPTERLDKALDAWTFWDQARSAVQPQMWRVLDGVVLEGKKLEDVGADIGRVQDRKRGQTIGLVVLRLALAALDEHFDKVDRLAVGAEMVAA